MTEKTLNDNATGQETETTKTHQRVKRCAKCIMPASHPDYPLDEENICSGCNTYQPCRRELLGEDKLLAVLRHGKNIGVYDALVPLSGGKDSTYILYYAVRKLGLRVMALSYDSCFQVPIAAANIRNACERLNVPLIRVRAPQGTAYAITRHQLARGTRIGQFEWPCANCESILRTVTIRTARQQGISNVLWGSSALESGTNETYRQYRLLGKERRREPSRVVLRMRRALIKLWHDPHLARRIPHELYVYIGWHSLAVWFYAIVQRLQMRVPFPYVLRPRSVPPFTSRNPRFIHFFDYVAWDSMQIIDTLREQLGWANPPNREARFDCMLHALGNFNILKRNGITSDGINACNFVREGKMEREAALVHELRVAESIRSECHEIAALSGLRDFQMPSLERG